MPQYVVDSCVLIASVIPEVHSETALQFLLEQPDLVAPSLARTEASHALTKLTRRDRQFSAADAVEAMNRILALHVDYVEVDEDLARSAHRQAIGHVLSSYDATYIALAMARNTQLATFDNRLLTHPAFRKYIVFPSSPPAPLA